MPVPNPKNMTILVLMAMMLSACDGWEFFQSDETPPTDAPYRLTVEGAETCPLPAGLDPKEVVIRSYRVRLLGAHPQGVPANYFYASLLTTDGSRYLADYPGCSPLLSASPLRPGETADGFLNFPLPPSATPEKLVYSPELTGKPVGSPLVEILLGTAIQPNDAVPANDEKVPSP